jgi:hypothetical protein
MWPPEAVMALVFGGVAVTFLLLYLLTGLRRGLRWALWPAGISAVLAVLFPFASEWYDLLMPILMIAGGLILLLVAFRQWQRQR